jgi:hypothetical protein
MIKNRVTTKLKDTGRKQPTHVSKQFEELVKRIGYAPVTQYNVL